MIEQNDDADVKSVQGDAAPAEEVSSPDAAASDQSAAGQKGGDENTQSEAVEPDSLEAAIRNANPTVEKPDEPKADSAEGDADATEGEDDKDAADAKPDESGNDEPDADGLTDEDRKTPQKTQRRIQQLLKDRKEVREELEALRPDVEAYRQVRTFMQNNDLDDQAFNTLLQVGAAIRKRDWQPVLTVLEPLVDQAKTALGRQVPKDLQQQVDDGYITEDMAKAYAKERAARELAEQRQQDIERRSQQGQQQMLRQTLQSEAINWEAAKRASDPDYERRSEAIKELVAAQVKSNGFPPTPQAARDMFDAVYARVQAMIPPLPATPKPAPKPTRATPDGESVPAAQTRPEPKNLEEAMQGALGG